MIHVLSAENQEIVRQGLRLLLESQPDTQVVGEVSNGQQVIDGTARLSARGKYPHGVSMDSKCRSLNRRRRRTKLLIKDFA